MKEGCHYGGGSARNKGRIVCRAFGFSARTLLWRVPFREAPSYIKLPTSFNYTYLTLAERSASVWL